MKRSLGKRLQRFTLTTCSKLKDNKKESSRVHVLGQPYKNASSPCLALSTSCGRTDSLPRSCSAIFYTDFKQLFDNHKLASQMLIKTPERALSTARPERQQAAINVMRGLEAVCACPCPCPGNCSCLPPPCNTPPKCLQYMTGYYYYPYGTWFCGPYHVSTGPCGPCTGPVTPGGPCGPSGPCPGGPCGPPGLACACGPLRCCGVCGSPNIPPNQTQNAFSSNTQFVPFDMQSMYAYGYNNNSVQYSYDPTTYSPYPPGHDMAMPWAQQNMPGPNMPGQIAPNRNPTGPFFGPGINVPISPIPIRNEPCGPILPTPDPSIPTSPKPKSSVRINSDYMQDSPTSPYGSKPPMPTRPPLPTSSRNTVYINKPYTGTRPISTIRNPCSSNLTPKPLRPGPPSRYDAICALSRHNPIAKPKINNRTLPRLDTIQICYYTTRSMKKYIHYDARLVSGEKKHGKHVRKYVQDKPSSLSHKVDRKSLCYWCLISDKNTCPCRLCGLPTLAQKEQPENELISNTFQKNCRQEHRTSHHSKIEISQKVTASQSSKTGGKQNECLPDRYQTDGELEGFIVSRGSKTELNQNEYILSDGFKLDGGIKEYTGSDGSNAKTKQKFKGSQDLNINGTQKVYISHVSKGGRGKKYILHSCKKDGTNEYRGPQDLESEGKHETKVSHDSNTDRKKEHTVSQGMKTDTDKEYLISNGFKSESEQKDYEKTSFKRCKWF